MNEKRTENVVVKVNLAIHPYSKRCHLKLIRMNVTIENTFIQPEINFKFLFHPALQTHTHAPTHINYYMHTIRLKFSLRLCNQQEQ